MLSHHLPSRIAASRPPFRPALASWRTFGRVA